MTKEEIRKTVAEIERIKGDDEGAHSLEDYLREQFIRFVAEQGGEIGELAKEVLKTEDIRFGRYTS